MTAAKKDSTTEWTVEKAVQELKSADVTRTGADSRKSSFCKMYKQFSREQRTLLCQEAAIVLKEKFDSEVRLESAIYLLGVAFAQERDWEAANALLEAVISKATSADFLRELSLILLEISDNELSGKAKRVPLAQTILVLLTELGMQLAANVGRNGLDPRETGRVVEYITTNLLARSNLNNMAMRISLVHYLAKCPLNAQGSLQLNRVISRFGQSLLDDMLTAFFEDKRKGNAAFFFLVEHLNSFFTASPALAEMSQNVLKHYMLKHPDEFPLFLASYCEFIPKEEIGLTNATRHIALLLRGAIEVNQRPLAESIGRILIRHLGVFRDASQEFAASQAETAVQLATAAGRHGKHPMLEEFLRDVRALTEPAATEVSQSKILTMSRRKPREASIKFAKVGEKPSPLEQMLQLAS
ncbi:MAG: hypothetical protein IOD12_10435 [Silvanigrellales bacterium]|jgi:hypothetical protein|nr:hypothetical protein [Silvanigrellales bacterium]